MELLSSIGNILFDRIIVCCIIMDSKKFGKPNHFTFKCSYRWFISNRSVLVLVVLVTMMSRKVEVQRKVGFTEDLIDGKIHVHLTSIKRVS